MMVAAFLTFRFDEDELAARLALEGAARSSGASLRCRAHSPAVAGHIARWSPDRVLAEVEAKRWEMIRHLRTPPINESGLRYCRVCLGSDTCDGYPDEWVQQFWPCKTLRLLALPYADHPDYREEWKP